MFTGLIEGLGTLQEVRQGRDGCRLTLGTCPPFADFTHGESIAVNGVCLTVEAFGSDFFQADVSPQTLASSTLGELRCGIRVNLERALRLGDRLGGHLVTGHVDGVGMIIKRESRGNSVLFTVQPPAHLLRYLVPKGSVALDGISLTISGLTETSFSLTIIPHSLGQTNLAELNVGARVNLETDILGKYVERLLSRHGDQEGSRRIDLEFLARNGYL
ncbi:riboflavin synthase alpha chain [Geoalkalibacter ferrihydriticus]|uniref:Riboflavin synthase n=2 Tax=Geoalkalibacter ferrihydriticus TaxID=392333 RepID=A0A0C2EFK3_9BACT|nr:riboflavin synthase [Geoalkalibacter ferrihydriticus]KIH77388.1 riboflavin synthase subunit alpha [Geoalkalibacter ferrihydriticus DSM 17813]SDM17106.1 riboflavin synthase alpha chain [Geoalkalibacter ferrihydriticus]